MRLYRTPFDAFLGLVLLLTQFVAMAIVGATVAHTAHTLAAVGPSFLPSLARYVFIFLPLVAAFVAAYCLRSHLLRGSIPGWSHPLVIVTTLLAIPASFLFFCGEMHDIALWFGSHGRWGCATVEADGSYYNIFHDISAPFFLFLPAVCLSGIHWVIVAARRGHHGATRSAGAEGTPASGS